MFDILKAFEKNNNKGCFCHGENNAGYSLIYIYITAKLFYLVLYIHRALFKLLFDMGSKTRNVKVQFYYKRIISS